MRANARQFGLLVVLNAVVGAIIGLERNIRPLAGERDFAVASTTAVLAFAVAFGAANAVANLAAGALVGPAHRGLALGLNEAAGFVGVSVTALATGTLVWTGTLALAAPGAGAVTRSRSCARRTAT